MADAPQYVRTPPVLHQTSIFADPALSDFSRRSLQPPYESPYPIISARNTFVTIGRKGRHDTVSMDRVELASPDTVDQRYSAKQESTTLCYEPFTSILISRIRFGRRFYRPFGCLMAVKGSLSRARDASQQHQLDWLHTPLQPKLTSISSLMSLGFHFPPRTMCLY